MLKIGSKIDTDTTLFDENEQPVTLGSYAGKYLVIYFYPRDNTPGCTVEACSFRDFNHEIENLGAKVIGISKDDVKSHNKFKDKQKLNFTLLSDPEHKLHEAFGVWAEKSFLGKKYFGALRATFIVDPTGKVIQVWEKVTPNNHAQEVYQFLEKNIK
jgi:peroxiredoxin Q/BCP